VNTTRNALATLRSALIRAYDYAEDTATKDALQDAHFAVLYGRTAEAAEGLAQVDGLPTWVADELDALFTAALDG
jgi:hypothetical protein